MARPCLIPTDPELLDKVIEYLALGLPCSEIAKMLGVHQDTVQKWKTKKGFSEKLGAKTVEILMEPAKALGRVNPGLFLQTHPSTRESHAPPKQSNSIDITGEVKFTVNLIKSENENDL